MQSVSPTRRLSAIVALVAVVAMLAVAVVGLLQRPLVLVVAIACLGVAIGAAAYALTRTGARRLVAAVVAILALAAPLALVVAYGRLLQLLLLIALVAVAAVATRHALGRDLTSLKSGPTPGTVVGPAIRPVLLMNPRSGGGKVERFHLVQEARRRGIEPVVLGPGDDLRRLAEQAVARGADVLGMAGGDGSQALVAGVAAAHDVAFVCVPAGTRNHLAMDLGLDRDDVVAALDAFGAAVERRIDLGLVDDQVFVNNATMGLYAKIVQSPAYRDHKVDTALELLPTMLGPRRRPVRPALRRPRRHRAPIRPSHLGLQQPLRAEPPGGLRVPAAPGRRDPWHRRGTAAVPRRGRQVRTAAGLRADPPPC